MGSPPLFTTLVEILNGTLVLLIKKWGKGGPIRLWQ